MKGLQIKINDKDEINIASDRVASIFINVGKDYQDNCIRMRGLDSKSYHLTWADKKIKVGDRISIKAGNISNITPLIQRTPSDRKELIKKYHILERELKEQGLI